VRFSTNIFFLQHITMSHKGDSSPKGKADNSSFVLQAMQQQFERLNFVLGELWIGWIFKMQRLEICKV
jgi:hypothetical protein